MTQPTIRVLEFETRYTRDGRPVDWVLYAPIHAIHTSQTWARIKDLKPPEGEIDGDRHGLKSLHMRTIWGMIEPAYNAWKAGQELPESGTPLGAWPGINNAQADVLRRAGLRSVEEVANMTDGQMQSIRLPDLRGLRRQAAGFLEAREDAQTGNRLAELEEQNAALMERLDELSKSIQKPQERHYNVDDIRAELDRRGIKYDKRWGAEKLLEALENGEVETA